MSMVLSTCCGRLIDSDDDPECFVGDDDIICAAHREEREERRERRKPTFASFDDFMDHVADERANEEKLHGEEA